MSARQAKMPPTPCPVIKAWVYLGGIMPAKPNNPPWYTAQNTERIGTYDRCEDQDRSRTARAPTVMEFILFLFVINKLTDVKKLNINYTQWLEWPHRDIISNNGVPQHAKRTTLKRDKYLDVILINRQTNALPRYAHRPQPPELKVRTWNSVVKICIVIVSKMVNAFSERDKRKRPLYSSVDLTTRSR